MIRTHTSRIQNTPNAPNGINLNNSDTQILHFETRLRQLDCAMQLEMYNEAFKIVEDICTINMLAKKIDRPSLMVEYYTKTADLFLRSHYNLFHAAALFKRYNIYRDHKKGISDEELSSLGSTALCAALAVPLPHARSHFSTFAGEYNQTKQKALATLLDLSTVPTRASLINDLTTSRVQSIVSPELVVLYEALEVDFQPLKLSQKIQPALQCISEKEDLAVYLESLHEVVVSKTLLQVSQVYRTLHFDELVRLCPFYDPLTLERCVVELIYNLELPMRFDHRRNAIIFDVYIDLGISQRDYSIGSFSGQTGTDQVSRQLTIFAQSLHQVAELFNLNESSTQVRDKMVKNYLQTAKEEHDNMLKRIRHIEDRKEQLEQMQKERMRTIEEEEGKLESEKRAKREQEEETLKKEAEQRNRRTAEEQLQMQIKDADFEQCSVEAIVEKLQGDICKRRSELMDRANARARKLDHFVRACRLQEIPLLQEAAVVRAKERFELHEKAQQEIIEESKRQHEIMLKNKDRLSRMKGDISELKKVLKAMEQAKHKERYAEWEALRARVREERLAERRAAEEEAKRKEQERLKAEERAQMEAKLREAEAAERRRKQEEEEEEKRRREKEREQELAKPAPQKQPGGGWQRRPANPSAAPPAPVPPPITSRKAQPVTAASSTFTHEQSSRGFQKQFFYSSALAEQSGQNARSSGPWARKKVNIQPTPTSANQPHAEKPAPSKPRQQDEDDGWKEAGKRH
nr:eukaryotic translation initiation factor 3 [Hymenolepis microstoma]